MVEWDKLVKESKYKNWSIITFEKGADYIGKDCFVTTFRLVKSEEYGISFMSTLDGRTRWISDRSAEKEVLERVGLTLQELWDFCEAIHCERHDFFGDDVIYFDLLGE